MPQSTPTPQPSTLGEYSLTAEQVAAQPDADVYAWVITEDRINTRPDETSRVGTHGPANAHDALTAAVQESGPHRVRFRMYDDDGNYYYGGFLTFDPELDATGLWDGPEPSYGPLVDFGMPDAGCTRITYPDRPALDCS